MPSDKAQARLRRKKRIRARIRGTAERPRLVVFRSNLHISAQLVDDDSGKTLVSASDVKDKKGTKTERAKKVGASLAEAAKKIGKNTCVFDRNGYQYHGRVKAVAEAAREVGLQF
ncbi:MAG: 50S ribosomal protein L18 [bacterium]|nr:50S ribosomal protein L18 [bacterium]